MGRDVLDGSALGEELSEALGEAVSQAGLKFLLIRQTGRAGRVLHGAPDASGNPTHRVLYALCTPGEEKLYSFNVSTPEQLLDLPLGNPQELIQATGAELMDSPPFSCAPTPSATAAVPCAVDPLRRTWRISCLVIWSGSARTRVVTALPRLALCYPPATPTVASRSLRRWRRTCRWRVVLFRRCTVCEYRSTDTPVEQAAEVAVRLELEKKGEEVTSGGLVSRETSVSEAPSTLREAGIEPPADTAKHPTMEAALTSHTDGRTWVTFFERVALEPRPNSCGKGPADAFSRELLALHQI